MYDSRIANEYSTVTCGCGCNLSDCGCINCHCIFYEENVLSKSTHKILSDKGYNLQEKKSIGEAKPGSFITSPFGVKQKTFS